MIWLEVIILGIVEGITEFLPISSTGHLTVFEKFFGWQIDTEGVTAFTAIIQVGAIIAAIVYFWGDIVRIVAAWFRGLRNKDARKNPDYTLAWGIILGSIPAAVVGLLFKGQIETVMRNLWVVVAALLLWSVVMYFADRRTGTKEMHEVTTKDALVIGAFQALAPIFPGISRSGATISAGLFLGYDRVTATRLSFFLGIPILVAAGGLETVSEFGAVDDMVGWGPTILATVISFVVAYASIAWLLKFVSSNSFMSFIVYRVVLALGLIVVLAMGMITAA